MVSVLIVRDLAASIEHQHNPNLKTVPLILLTGNKRLRVLATNLLARHAGVEIGITERQSELICPNAERLRAREDVYRRIFMEITEALIRAIGKVEAHYHSRNALWYVNSNDVEELKILGQIIETRLNTVTTIGTGSNKFVARVASATANMSVSKIIAEGEEVAFLAPYSVNFLPLNKDMKRRLPMMGITNIGQLAKLSRGAVFEQFGKNGRWCHDLSLGVDPRPLQSTKPPLVLRQFVEFDEALHDKEIIVAECLKLAQILIHQLNDREARTTILSLQDADGITHEKRLQPSAAIRDVLQLQRQLPFIMDNFTFSTGIQYLSLQLAEIAEITPTQLSLFDIDKSQQSVDKAVGEWQTRFHEMVYQPKLTDMPQLSPPELQFEYAVVGA